MSGIIEDKKTLRNLQKQHERSMLFKKIKSMRVLFLFLIFPFAFIFLFNYGPMYGILMAFKNFRYAEGIIGSQWNDFAHFKALFNDVLFSRAFFNTLRISIVRIFITFPMPIILALLINELRNFRFKKIVQTISYLPHFMSWVVIALIVYQVLSPEVGVLNIIIKSFGIEPIYFQGKKEFFIPTLLTAQIWQGTGWGSIIYIASISSVNPELYESANLDGANRFHKAIYITIPAIAPIITIQFILSFSGIMRSNFDAVYNLYNGLVMEVADVIDTFSFRAGLESGRFDYATAIGLFQNVIGLIIVLLVNKVANRISEYTLW